MHRGTVEKSVPAHLDERITGQRTNMAAAVFYLFILVLKEIYMYSLHADWEMNLHLKKDMNRKYVFGHMSKQEGVIVTDSV